MRNDWQENIGRRRFFHTEINKFVRKLLLPFNSIRYDAIRSVRQSSTQFHRFNTELAGQVDDRQESYSLQTFSVD